MHRNKLSVPSSCGQAAGSRLKTNAQNIMPKQFCVYILASDRNGTLYIGVTSNLTKRIWQHKNKVVDGFTKDYNVSKLVYYELHDTAESAIRREKRLKFWQRNWKKDLIEESNPEWKDLYNDIAISV